jgi:uroporphyrinogen-III decarboxylase
MSKREHFLATIERRDVDRPASWLCIPADTGLPEPLPTSAHPTSQISSGPSIKRLSPTGLVISPSHEAILLEMPPSNIAALFRAVHEP